MSTLLIAVASFVGFIVAYHTYGRWLARKIFVLDPKAPVPSHQLRDDIDYVPTKRGVIFGHHFTSIAGTGPIVGPAIAVFWGWLPALLWVVFGSIFIGAVHDFSALVVSLRNRGQTVGEIAGRIISPRAKILFLLILFFALTIVLAIFGLVIASIFNMYPESVISVWIEIPLAIGIGFWVYKKGGGLLIPSIAALAIMYGMIYVGVYYMPVTLNVSNPVVVWTIILLVYCFIASVLPVWTLLQPRDYINSHQLILVLGLLVLGLFVAGVTGQASLIDSAPAVVPSKDIPADAPPIWPFLFITIACGAVSGFHCVVSSGTTSKQVSCETDAQYVGYGAMLLEGALAVIVILACCAGVGMGGLFEEDTDTGAYTRKIKGETTGNEKEMIGSDAWRAYYPIVREFKQADGTIIEKGGWGSHKLPQKIRAFIEGGGNFLTTLGIKLELAIGIIAVLVASFAATTLDTATRLQRYVIQELATTAKIRPLTNKYAATALAVIAGGAMAMIPGAGGKWGTGGLILWPLFGATNQLLAGMALMVTVFYLWRRKKPIWFAAVPMGIMIIFPFWALSWQLFNPVSGWWEHPNPKTGVMEHNYLLFGIGLTVLALQIWMIVEGLLTWRRAKGVLEETLPPLEPKVAMVDGRSC